MAQGTLQGVECIQTSCLRRIQLSPEFSQTCRDLFSQTYRGSARISEAQTRHFLACRKFHTDDGLGTAMWTRQIIYYVYHINLDYKVAMLTIDLVDGQRLARIHRDFATKKDVCYLAESRHKDLLLLCQSIPLLAQFINSNLSNGESWDKVSVAGLFDAVNRRGGRHGGYHKGKFRISSIPLDEASNMLESVRGDYERAVVVAGSPHRYEMTSA